MVSEEFRAQVREFMDANAEALHRLGTRPPPLTCPVCDDVTDAWTFDAESQQWEFDDEWWGDPFVPEDSPAEGYTCSRWCYLKRLEAAEARRLGAL